MKFFIPLAQFFSEEGASRTVWFRDADRVDLQSGLLIAATDL